MNSAHPTVGRRGATLAAALTFLVCFGGGRVAIAQEPPSAPKEPGAVVQEPPAALETAGAESAACAAPGFDWSKVPPVRPLQPSGMFFVPPTGPGYYSLMDMIEGKYREKAPFQPYGRFGLFAPSFYDLDYRYLDNPENTQTDYLDPLKRIHPTDDCLLSFGGQTWARYMNEQHSRLSAKDDTYTLFRSRLFADAWYLDRLRIFGEFIYAENFGSDIDPRPIDINRSDAENLFFELKLFSFQDRASYLRTGRQEVSLGSQRLISAPDFANNRRTFQGVRGYRQGEKWDIDVFWLQPVINNRNDFDSVDDLQNLYGAWVTYRPKKGSGIDTYFLDLNNANRTAKGQGGVLGASNTATVGTRFYGNESNFLYDFEGMLQAGDFSNQNLFAGAFTATAGYNFAKVPFSPQFWVGYDYASGESNPQKTGDNSTFNQLFPFGHYYFGYLDLVGRQNIHDINGQFTVYPAPWITAYMQYHHFFLDSPRDALYNAAGLATRVDPTGRAGRQVGGELDFVVSFHLSTHTDMFIGYSKLFSGNFIAKTGPDVSPELFYVQYGYRW